MARLDDLQFDTTHWQLVEKHARQRVWVNDQGDMLSLLLCHGQPGIPVSGAAQAFGEQLRITLAPAGGEVLSVEEREAVGTRVVLAFACRPEGTGKTYTASIFVPFARFSYTVLVECPENGIAGVREAMQACAQWSGQGPVGVAFDAEMTACSTISPLLRSDGSMSAAAGRSARFPSSPRGCSEWSGPGSE